MTNNSSTGGYLVPSSSSPLDDDAFMDFMGDVFAGVTGLDRNLVRPRWQLDPPAFPDFATDWLAFGVASTTFDAFAYEARDLDPAVDADILQRNQTMDIDCSFFGPHADGVAGLLKDGLSITQNREAMFLASVAVVGTGDLARAPVFQKERWLNRTDMTVTIRRQIIRVYPILYLLSAAGSVSGGRVAVAMNTGTIT